MRYSTRFAATALVLLFQASAVADVCPAILDRTVNPLPADRPAIVATPTWKR